MGNCGIVENRLIEWIVRGVNGVFEERRRRRRGRIVYEVCVCNGVVVVESLQRGAMDIESYRE